MTVRHTVLGGSWEGRWWDKTFFPCAQMTRACRPLSLEHRTVQVLKKSETNGQTISVCVAIYLQDSHVDFKFSKCCTGAWEKERADICIRTKKNS